MLIAGEEIVCSDCPARFPDDAADKIERRGIDPVFDPAEGAAGDPYPFRKLLKGDVIVAAIGAERMFHGANVAYFATVRQAHCCRAR